MLYLTCFICILAGDRPDPSRQLPHLFTAHRNSWNQPLSLSSYTHSQSMNTDSSHDM